MNIQDAFDIMARGFAKQNWQRSTKPNAGCSLINDLGHRCSIGHLSTIEECEANQIQIPFVRLAKILGLPLNELGFLNHAQMAHDDAEDSISLKNNFRELQKSFKLIWPGDVPIE